MTSEPVIQNVSDTAIWVAYYRALESEKINPLFKDTLAKILVAERGQKIAESMKQSSKYTQWSVIIRTFVIDQLIQKLVKEGVDTVVNLGAGLDTRPYRLQLPSSLRWIEIDYPHMIEYKEKLLQNEKPNVQLERISLDLADRNQRKEIFSSIGTSSKKVLVLTEGVILYLTEDQVTTLGEDLFAQKNFHFWIAEYFSPEMYPYFKTNERLKGLKNAPFKFFPQDWFDFFKQIGWKSKEIKYLPEEAKKVNRSMPIPWWGYVLSLFLSRKKIQSFRQRMGYVVFVKN